MRHIILEAVEGARAPPRRGLSFPLDFAPNPLSESSPLPKGIDTRTVQLWGLKHCLFFCKIQAVWTSVVLSQARGRGSCTFKERLTTP